MPEDSTKLMLIAAVGLVVAVYAFFHARAYREGFPPVFDAFFSLTAFVLMCGAFIYGGRIGAQYDMTTEGRIAGLGAVVVVLRWLRARLGIELAEWKARK